MTRTSFLMMLPVLAIATAGFAQTRGGMERDGQAVATVEVDAQEEIDASVGDASFDPALPARTTCELAADIRDGSRANLDHQRDEAPPVVAPPARTDQELRARAPASDRGEALSFGLMRMERNIPFAP
jgi:hypothetical protein